MYKWQFKTLLDGSVQLDCMHLSLSEIIISYKVTFWPRRPIYLDDLSWLLDEALPPHIINCLSKHFSKRGQLRFDPSILLGCAQSEYLKSNMDICFFVLVGQPNPNLCWIRQGFRPALFPNTGWEAAGAHHGARDFFPLPQGKPYTALWDCSDLYLQNIRHKSEQPGVAQIGAIQLKHQLDGGQVTA